MLTHVCINYEPNKQQRRISKHWIIPHILRNLTIYCRLHNSTFPGLIQSQRNHITLSQHFPLKGTIPTSTKWSLPFSFSGINLVCISRLRHALYMPCLSHSPLRDYYSNNFPRCAMSHLLIPYIFLLISLSKQTEYFNVSALKCDVGREHILYKQTICLWCRILSDLARFSDKVFKRNIGYNMMRLDVVYVNFLLKAYVKLIYLR